MSITKVDLPSQEEADRYRGSCGTTVRDPCRSYGQTGIPVLGFLNGCEWDGLALSIVASIRPSSIRVTSGELTCNAHPGRVTVYLNEDGRTIRKIDQEVTVFGGCGYAVENEFVRRYGKRFDGSPSRPVKEPENSENGIFLVDSQLYDDLSRIG